MNVLVDVIDEQDKVIDLMWAAFLGIEHQRPRKTAAKQHPENGYQTRSDLVALQSSEQEEREAA